MKQIILKTFINCNIYSCISNGSSQWTNTEDYFSAFENQWSLYLPPANRVPLHVMHWTSLYRPCGPSSFPSHATSLYRDQLPHPSTWDLTEGDPLPWPPLVVTSGSQDWRPFQTCSLEDPPPVLTSAVYWSMCSQHHKWVVRILLECFLIFRYVYYIK